MDKNEELQKWLNDDRYIRAQDLMMTLNMDNRQVTRLLKKHKIHAAKRIYIGRHIDGRYLGQFAFFDKNQCLAFLEKWENGYDKHIFMSLNDICDTFNTNASIVKAFFKRNKIKKCEMHRDANNYRIALYDKQIITMLWTAERGLLQNLQPNPDLCKISELEILFKISDGHVRRILRLYNIKPIRKNPSTIPDLYCKKQCIDSISSFNIQKKPEHYDNDTLNQLITNPKYITTTELENEFGVSKQKINYIFRKKGIAPLKKIYTPHGLRAFYDRAECERARPFINQPEKKEVEQVENIEELATATKHQILIEACADDFVWDKVTMKNKIMPVKNYCDERGNFVSLFKKDETVSAILAYKNEQKQLLEKCIADENLVTTKTLEKLWGIDRESVYQKIYKLKIKPHVKIRLENGNIWNFYKKSDCVESQDSAANEESRLINNYQSLVENKDYITLAELAELFNKTVESVAYPLRKNKIKFIESACPRTNRRRVFYEKHSAISVVSEHYADYNANKYNSDIHATLKDLVKCTNKSIATTYSRISSSGIRPIFSTIIGKARVNVYDRRAALSAISDILKPRYRKLIARDPKEIKTMEEKQMELPKPTEQTPDIIPADTIDLFTMSELESEFKKRGIELTAEVRAKINASDMPEMQHIATMMRGNAKTIAIRLSVLNEIAGQLREVDCENNDEDGEQEVFYSYQQASELLGISMGSLRNKVNAIGMILKKSGVKAFFTAEQIESLRKQPKDQNISPFASDNDDRFNKIMSRLNEIEHQIVYHENFGPSEDIINHFKSAIQSRSNVLSALMSKAKIVIHNESCVILLDQKFAVDKVGESKSKEMINNALMDIGCKDFNIYVLFSGKQDVKNNQEK